MLISVGDKVNTEHGQGTVLGFEQFGVEGRQIADYTQPIDYPHSVDAYLTSFRNYPRISIKLDTPELWVCSEYTSGYYMTTLDFLKLNHHR